MNYLKILFLLLICKTYSQSFKEAIDFHDNGKVKTEYVKNIDLKLIKVNVYDINEKLVEFTNYDPETGNKDGSFMEGTNEGFYDQNKLNCKFCSILVSNYRYNNIKFEGEFKNGYPVGQIDVYKLFEASGFGDDEYVRFLLTMEEGKQMNYSSLVGLDLWVKRFLYTLNFNPDGLLDGNMKISKTSELSFKNGLLSKILSKNPKNESIYKDSLGRDFKVWKIDNKYYRNTGFLNKFSWNDYEGDTSFSVSSIEVNNNEDRYRDHGLFFFGSEKTKYINGYPLVVFEGYKYSPILNKSGVFQRKINGDHYDSSYSNDGYSLEDLIFSLPLDLDNYNILIDDTPIENIIDNLIITEKRYWEFDERDPLPNEDSGIVLILNEFKRSLNEGVEFTPREYYKFVQKILDDPGSPFTEVYVVNPELAFNSLSKSYRYTSFFEKYQNEENRFSSIFKKNDSLKEKEVFYETYKKYHTKKLQEYEERKRKDSFNNSKKTDLQLDKSNDSKSSSNQIITTDNSGEFDDNFFELTGTSLKKENKKKYNWMLKATAKRISGCIKIHLLSYNNGKEIDTKYSKYFFENVEYLTQFKNYINSEGLYETVFQKGATLYIRRKKN